ncbi:MAG TPA: trypsin-like peptidase domain-containing protein [Pyrinomonadaceae bacterium]|nr:trypsin-like peptidase domain-containing protein [Pyrinomonadaceae bacterium]
MLSLPKGRTTDTERAMLRRLKVWIAALAAACLVVGISVGALLSSRLTVAQEGGALNNASVQQAARAPEALSASFALIARRVEPAVVNIDTISEPEQAAKGGSGGGGDDSDEEGEGGGDLPPGHPLQDMFRNLQRRPAKGVGSGFIVDPKGYILTNQHVVDDASRINVKLQTGEVLRGRVVGVDEETDLAVIKVQAARDLPAVRLGNSDEVEVGDWVLAVGSPFGLEQTVTAGIISTKERQTTPGATFQRFLQTDAAINRGNSGGPLVNMRGEVIGVNSQIATSTGDYNGIGFALPSNEASFVYRQLLGGGKVRRGYLGVFLDSVKAEFARVYGLAEAKGAVITDVRDADGPAAKAGIQTNDIVVEFNSQPVTSAQDLINKVAGTPVGQTVQVTYLRDVNGKLERRTAAVTVGERPARERLTTPGGRGNRGEGNGAKTGNEKPGAGANGAAGAEAYKPTLGMTLSELTPQLSNEKSLRGVRGLLVREVDLSGLAYEAGVRKDMVVQRVNRVSVGSLADFERVVGALKPGDAIVMHVAAWDDVNSRLVQTIIQFTYQ